VRIVEELKGKQKRYLRGLGHELQPIVFIGKEGVSPAAIRSVREAYHQHELIKIRLERGCAEPRRGAAEQLAAATESHLVQVLGRTVLLYRPDPDEPQIQLP